MTSQTAQTTQTGPGAGGSADAVPAPGARRRIALVVAYDGSGYAGFQWQANAPTIQGELEGAIARLTGEIVRIRGASRTDAGAHARGQVADFATGCPYPAAVIRAALNHYLPDAVRVVAAGEMPAQFHARRSAARRRYQYRILNRQVASPLLRHTHHLETERLNLAAMRRAAESLIGVRDFRQVATGHPAEQSAVRQVFHWDASRHPPDGDVIIIECIANGFLRHQIRRVNALLTEIGKGRLPIHSVAEALAGRLPLTRHRPATGHRPATRHRPAGGMPAGRQIAALPAKALCLQSVHYPGYDHLLKVDNCHETN